VRFGGRSFEHSAGDRSGHNGWYSGMCGSRGAVEDLSAYTRYPRRQRFYSTDHQSGSSRIVFFLMYEVLIIIKRAQFSF